MHFYEIMTVFGRFSFLELNETHSNCLAKCTKIHFLDLYKASLEDCLKKKIKNPVRCVHVFYKIMRLPRPFIEPLKYKGSQFFASQSRLNHNKAVLIITHPFSNMQSRIKYR